LPVNDDAFCYFYISVAESYLDSNGYTTSEYTSSYTADSSFIGAATNSMLPFKTRSGGFMSEYYDGYYPSQKFLTAFTTPVLTPDNYFDLSFIRTRTGTGYLQREVYVDDVLKEVYQDSLTSTGILRMPIERSGWSEDRIDATIYNTDTKTAALTTTGTQTQTIGCYIPVGTTPNGTYSYSLSIASAGGGSTVTVSIKYNGSETIYSQTINTSTSASGSNIALPAPAVALATSIDITVTVVNGTSASRSGSGQVTLISQVSETLSIDVDTDCSTQDYYLTWLNIYGGFDYWNFKARKTYSVDVFDNTTSDRNIYTNWPNSYSEFADTITEQTSRRSKNVITVSSQYLTTAQEDAIKYILSSPLVQVVVSKYDKRTIIVNPSSYKIRKDQDDTRSISFEIAYTDNIPSQSL
jgi:hypothetical protein